MSKSLACVAAAFLTLTLCGATAQPRGRSAEVLSQVASSSHGKPAAAARVGALVLVGGGSLPAVVRQRFIELAGGKDGRLVIIPSASSMPNAAQRSYAFWKTAPVKSVHMLHTTSRSDADKPSFYGVLREATGVWISGGDQSRLTALFGGTAVERELANVLRRGGVVGGTSAGASVVTEVMLAGTGKTGKGFGLLAQAIVDQHFSNRHRLPRLLDLLRVHPKLAGLGIDEETAAVIRGGEVTVMGNATVTVARANRKGPAIQVYRAGSHFPEPMPFQDSRLATPKGRG
jgi:cyanophycinase